MTIFNFFEILNENIGLYLIALGIVGLIYFFLMKNIVRSVLDPIFIPLIGTAFANTVPLFLYFCGVISNEYIIYLICIETVFWIAYFAFSRKQISFNKYEVRDGKASMEIYKIMFVLCVCSHVLTYAVLGIPLFKGTHTETFSGGGGWGLLSYVQKFSLFFVITYSYYLLGIKRNLLLAKAAMVLAVLFCLLSGSKSSILIFAFTYFFYTYYYRHKDFNLKKYKKFVLLICLFPVVILMAHSGSGVYPALIGVGERIVAYGDMYWMALPNNVMDSVVIKHPFIYLFQGILGPLRLIDYSVLDTNMGIQLTNLVYPDLIGSQFAPNSRLALLGWVSFGWSGLILSFVLGGVFAFIRTRLYSILPNGIIPVIIYGFIYTQMTSVLGDPILAIGNIFTVMIFIVILWAALYLFYGRIIKLKKVQ